MIVLVVGDNLRSQASAVRPVLADWGKRRSTTAWLNGSSSSRTLGRAAGSRTPVTVCLSECRAGRSQSSAGHRSPGSAYWPLARLTNLTAIGRMPGFHRLACGKTPASCVSPQVLGQHHKAGVGVTHRPIWHAGPVIVYPKHCLRPHRSRRVFHADAHIDLACSRLPGVGHQIRQASTRQLIVGAAQKGGVTGRIELDRRAPARRQGARHATPEQVHVAQVRCAAEQREARLLA